MDTRTPESIFAPGRVLQNRYRLDEAIAVGGMAEVWRGHDLVLQRPVAVKLLHPHLASDPALTERFRREAVSAARLSHPHIVPTYDAGTDGDAAYIVLGLIHGPTLAETLKTSKLEPRQAVSIARQVADALDHAHRAGLIHRDIKPANVLVVDDDHRIMVADFGIAKAVAEAGDESLTLPGLVIGTPAYLAPEQANGSDADARSDIFATGVLLHEMLCGHTSVDAPTQLSDGPGGDAVHTNKCDALPKNLAQIVEKATDPDPAKRYQTAADLQEALLAGEKSMQAAAPRSGPIRMPIAPPKPPNSAGKAQATKWTTGEDTAQHSAIESSELPSPPADRPSVGKSRQPAPAVYPMPEPSNARRRSIAVAVVVIVLIALAVGTGRLVGSMSDKSAKKTTTSVPAVVGFAAARSFDPLGDKSENEAQVANVIDSKPETVWSTETYSTRTLGGLKPGVGIVLQTAAATKFSKLQIVSSTTGWSAKVYVSDSAKTSLADWGNPVDSQSGLQGSATFDLHQATGSYVLVWFTDLGDANRVTVSEAHLVS